MRFVTPQFLGLMILVPMLATFIVLRERQRWARLNLLGDADLVAELVLLVSWSRRWWKTSLWLLAVAAVIVAMARPTWGLSTNIVETQGISVMVVLDVSNSMLAEDILPNRLERAKLGIRDLLESIGGNEVGLIVFAGDPFVMFPLTTDPVSALTFLNAVSTDTISRQGTALGEALQLALDTFNERTATDRLIVLITDGEDHGTALSSAVNNAVVDGVPVHVLGYGSVDGASIPIRNSAGEIVGQKRDRAGNVVITTLDEATLRDVAQQTGGTYQRITPDNTEIRNLVRIVNNAEGSILGEDTETRGVERFALFVLLAVLLLSIEILLPETRTEPLA